MHFFLDAGRSHKIVNFAVAAMIAVLTATGSAASVLPYCEHSSQPAVEPEGFAGWKGLLLSSSSYPHHFANDVIAVVGHEALVEGKFTYGPMTNDLNGEWVEFWFDDCDGQVTKKARVLTDADGRGRWLIKPKDLPAPGFYRVHMRVAGDNSFTDCSLQVLPAGSQIAVFDLDSTLTVSDLEPLKDLWCYETGTCSAQILREGAKAATLLREKQGHYILYLTGRHYVLTNVTKHWFHQEKFAAGATMLSQSIAQIIPYEGYVGDFKLQVLLGLKQKGLNLACAYGNAVSDIYAYQKAGIPSNQIFIFGFHGGSLGTVDLGESYSAHLEQMKEQYLD